MLILTPSIMHSGTHLLRYDILKDYQEMPANYNKNEDYRIGFHFTDWAHGGINEWVNKVDHIVSPMRHPARILESFKRRGRRVHPSEPMPNPYEVPGTDFHSQWENLRYYHGLYKIHYIHVDDFENRDQQVKEFGAVIGRELTATWPLDKKKSNAVSNTHALEITQDLEDAVPQWILDFYYNEIVAGKPRKQTGRCVSYGIDAAILPKDTVQLLG